MIVHGATIAAIFVAILSAFENCARVADGYVLPKPNIILLKPKGFQIWIPHEEGMQFFKVEGNVNRDISFNEVGVISGATYEHRRMKWIIQFENVNYRNGDTIYFWTYALVNGVIYSREYTTLIDETSKLLFDEIFNFLDEEVWRPVYKFPLGPDFEFCAYVHNMVHASVKKIEFGTLIIKPLIFPQDRFAFGTAIITNCTSILPAECNRTAAAFNIVPPVQTAKFTTQETFSFQYGKIEIRAKFPEGDWLYPEMYLEPKYNNYGTGYSSGRVLLGLARGNDNLINATSGEIFDSRKLEFGIITGEAGNVKKYMVSKIKTTNFRWTKTFHVYTTIWNRDGFQFLVDNEEVGKLVPEENGWMKNQLNKIAPFDQEFYITIGLGVGGIRIFPDGTTSSGVSKPWRNVGAKAMLQFWRAKHQWLPSWKRQKGQVCAFEIDYIRVWSL